MLGLQSGGGSVSKCDKPSGSLTKAISKGLDLAIMSTDKDLSDAGVKQLLKAKVPCATAQFVVECLAHPHADLNQHILFKSRIGWSAELGKAADLRASVREHPMSPPV